MAQIKKFEIWIGDHHLGQGFSSPKKPIKIGEEWSTSFKAACMKQELRSKLKSIEKQEEEGYVTEQDLQWFYNPNSMNDGWLGKRFPSYEEALGTFKNDSE